jgi:hypothetical protein
VSKSLDMFSIISAKDGNPLVQFKFDDDHKFQLSPDEAREHATKIIEVAFAAESDAFLVHFLVMKTGLEIEKAIVILKDFRDWREGKNSKTDQMRWKSFFEQTDKKKENP